METINKYRVSAILVLALCLSSCLRVDEEEMFGDYIFKNEPTGTENGHEWVDLGLPSGTKWATCNVGATKPEEYGNYFAWGEIEPKFSYSYDNYYYDDSDYDSDWSVLPLDRDAARANWGGAWSMPTDAEWIELVNCCTWTAILYNGVEGYKVTSKINGNSIFLPAAGFRTDDDFYTDDGLNNAGFSGNYWSSSLDTDYSDYASGLYFYSDYVDRNDSYRYYGQSVRPVLNKDKDYNATGTENGHGYADLGLPSGTKWATCNVGATKPEEYGNYYAWGETEPKTTYSWSTYKWCNGSSSTLTKYNTSSSYGTVDNKTVLEPEDDAARANWGGQWRMPTSAESQELIDNCSGTWTSDYNGTGVAGLIVTSKINGNSIFLPAAGCRYNGVLGGAGSGGYYWLSSLGTDNPKYAWNVYLYSDDVSRDFDRSYGLSVRPVLGE